MKRSILIGLILLISSIKIFGQDIINPPALSNIVLPQAGLGFVLGWNWSSEGSRLDSTLNINTYHYMYLPATDYKHGLNVFDPLPGNITSGRKQDNIFNAMSIYLEPTIKVDSTENFKARAGDNTGAVFGFRFRNLNVCDTVSSGNDFSRIILHSNRVTNRVTVLDSIWNGSLLHWEDYDGADNKHKVWNGTDSVWIWADNIGRTNAILDSLNKPLDQRVYQPFNGKQFYITINLKATRQSDLTSHLTDTILVIKLPYKSARYDSAAYHGTGLVKFDSIPEQSYTLNREIRSTVNNQFRGIYRQLKSSPSQPDSLIITGEMLKNLSSLSSDSSITISAFAEFDGVAPGGIYNNNPFFRNDWWENRYRINEFITNINVQVIYYGKVDCKIDWLRLETPRSRDIFRGRYDDSLRKVVDTLNQWVANNPSHPHIARFYGNDELLPMQWAAERYLNYILDTLLTNEFYLRENNLVQLKHAVNYPDTWTGDDAIHEFGNFTAAPYMRSSNADRWHNDATNAQSMNLYFGYSGNSLFRTFSDSLHSGYELSLIYVHADVNGNWYYDLVNYPPHGIDTMFTRNISDPQPGYLLSGIQSIYDRYSWIYHNKQNLLYDKKNWWANIWITPYIGNVPTHDRGYFLGSRPLTGEEVRLGINQCLSLGTKGLLYYYKTELDDIANNAKSLGIEPHLTVAQENNLPNDLSFILSDSLEGDFIKLHNDPFGLNNFIDTNVINLGELGISANRIYIGTKSIRLEIYNIHKFIKNNETLLMNLRLAACLNKGLLKFYSQHPNLNSFRDTILSNFIDFHNIKTRPIGRVDGHGNPYYEQSSGLDSGFYDITLHRDMAHDTSMLDTFYICVVNRRTDPLVRPFDTLSGGIIDSSMKFYSTAEFDLNTRDSGITIAGQMKDSLYWRDLYFKRQGCREINIQFSYSNPSDTNEYALLHLSELKDSTAKNNNWWWYRQEKWNRSVDTTIGQDNRLALNFLPGESRWFKVTVYHPQKNIEGFLANSNQHKLTVTPYMHPNGTEDPDSVRYHLVYYKTIQIPTTHYAVFYRRSHPVSKNTPSSAVQWENEINLSDTIATFIRCSPPSPFVFFRNSYYPSIAVRKEGNSQFAYVVFQSEASFAGVHYYNFCEPYQDTCYYKNPIYEARLLVSDTDHAIKMAPASIIEYIVHDTAMRANPTINAGTTGNYIVFADSVCGLKIVYQDSASTSVKYVKRVRGDFHSIPTDWTVVRHPSVNPYSVDNSVSVVWEQKQYDHGLAPGQEYNSYICYSRFTTDSYGIKAIPVKPISGYPLLTDTVNNVIRISPDLMGEYDKFPVVIGYKSGLTYDNIAYQYSTKPMKYSYSLQSGIVTLSLVHHSSFSVCSQYAFISDASIDITYQPVYMINPNLSFNSSYGYDNGIYNIKNSLVLDFVKTSVAGSLEPTFDHSFSYYSIPKTIYQAPISQFQFLTHEGDFEVNDVGINKVFDGAEPHFATAPVGFTSNEADIWKQERIANYFGSTTTILTNPKLFYKTGYNEDLIGKKFVGFTNDSDFYVFAQPKVDGNDIGYDLPYDLVHDSTYGDYYMPNGKDTIFTDWFTVGSISTLVYDVARMCSDTNLVRTAIQKRTTGVLYPIPLAPNTFIFHKSVICKLIAGHNDDYRFVIYKPDTMHGAYSERIFINLDSSFVDTLNMKSSVINEKVIYLNENPINVSEQIQFTIQPNPAQNQIFVKGDLPASIFLNSTDSRVKNRISYKIFNSIGIEMGSYLGNSGEMIEIPTGELSGGVYFIRAEVESNYFSPYDVTPAVQTVVIEK